MDVKDVDLAEFKYPCVSYVARRLGLDLPPDKVQRLYSLHGEPYKDGETKLSVGDVLVWIKKDAPKMDVSMGIGPQGVVTTRVDTARHFGVYEGHRMVSDLVYPGDRFHPQLRMMNLDEDRAPDLYIVGSSLTSE